jgi:hypothetical protein
MNILTNVTFLAYFDSLMGHINILENSLAINSKIHC